MRYKLFNHKDYSVMVSKCGQVMTVERKVNATLKRGLGAVETYKVIKPVKLRQFEKNGYHYVNIKTNNKLKRVLVHRLVMMTFCPVDNPETLEVNHKDFDKSNNQLSNLEWVTKSQNIAHAVAGGRLVTSKRIAWDRARVGERNPKSTLTRDVARKIFLAKGLQKDIANKYKTHQTTVSAIKLGKLWASDTEDLRIKTCHSGKKIKGE